MARLNWEKTNRKRTVARESVQEAQQGTPRAMYQMRAKYPGTCTVCKGPIAAGQVMLWHRATGAQHVGCGSK